MFAQIRNFSFSLTPVVARCVRGSDQVLIGTSTTSQLPRHTEKAAVWLPWQRRSYRLHFSRY